MRHLSLLLMMVPTGVLLAQTDTLSPKSLPPVTIAATRMETVPARQPFAIAVLNKNRLQTAQQQLSVYDALATIPGVFVQNPDNFAQDLRISIRGFGARAAFGIRGIRIINDGIPESTPDGQADVDNIDVGALQSMEVLKGGSSALYGNASGGVIYLKTEEPTKSFGEIQMAQGSYGFQRYQAKAAFQRGKVGSFFSLGYNQQTGYRQHEAMRQLVFNNKWRLALSEKTALTVLLNYANSPQADDPGGLTSEQVATDRRQARQQNITFDAGEKMQQGRVGMIVTQRIRSNQRLTVRGFLTARQFSNRLAFQNGGAVEIDRLFGGGGVQYEWASRLFQRPYRTQIGLDADGTRDHRQRFQNNEGMKGERTFDQNEKFSSVGAYWLNEWAFTERWLLTAAARVDQVTLAVEDRFGSDGNQSGRIPLQRFSPSAGLSFQLKPAVYAYLNTTSNFETPTLNELSANPNNTGGFNPNLQSQKAWSNELGLKATFWAKLRLDAAFFLIHLRDEFVPYQLDSFPGRTFYKNAGRSQRQGIELGLQWAALPTLSFSVNYTYSDFRYRAYASGGQDFGDHRTPGIPEHQAFAEVRWAAKWGLTTVAQLRYVGAFFTNDANTSRNDAYSLTTWKVGYRHDFRRWSIEPFAGVNNLFDASYNANVLINGAGDRFYEPGAGISGYVGIKLGFGH